MSKRYLFLLALVAILAATGHPAVAQVGTPTPNEINAIAKDLWCPLCNGVRLDNCDLQACIQMREVIVQKLMAGESKQQITAYFVQQYGDVVLGAPANTGFNRIIWLLPVLIGGVALGWLIYLVRTWVARPSRQSVPTTPSGNAKADDEYLKRVDEELKERY